MSDHIAIRAEGLGKRYRVASGAVRHDSIRDLIVEKAKALVGGRKPHAAATREFWALQDATFEIRKGENVGIIGLNGAGKSTLLKILSRITEPTKGRATIDGRVGALLEVGTGFHLELTGRENVFLYGSILGMRRDEIGRKFDAIVEFAGIADHIDTPVKRYSSGMYVRLAFAVAAHLEPEILFLDEVLAVGDMAFQRKCIDFAKNLQQRDATILFVSHNMFSIKSMCERVIYLKQGRVEYDGDVDGGIEIYERDCRLSTLGWRGAPKPEEWPIFITHCDLAGQSGQPSTLFDMGDRVKVRIAYEVRRPVPHPNFMVSFVRSDGVTCCTYSTEVDGIDMGYLSEDGTIEIAIPPLKLVAEMYSVPVTVREKGFQQILCGQLATTFHVRDSLLDTHFGVFHEKAEWHLGSRSVRAPEVSEAIEEPAARPAFGRS
jgi:lipopolysaccharide transport system ATP-binding protein